MCCNDAPDPPDYGAIANASEEAARIAQETAREQLEWNKEQYAQNLDILNRVLDVQLPLAEARYRDYEADRARFEEQYQPFEDEFLETARTYDTPERREREAARAISDVSTAFEAQRQNAQQTLESYGIDPSQTRAQALDKDVRIAEAVAQSAAAEEARDRVENKGLALTGEAINIGRGYPGQVATAAGQAAAIGSQGTAGATNLYGTGIQGYTAPNAYMRTGNQALNIWGNTLSADYANQLAAYNAGGGFEQALGGVLGAAAGQGSLFGLQFNEGGEVIGPRGRDAIPARVQHGEYIIPAEVVHRKGTEHFDKLVKKTQEDLIERNVEQAVPAGNGTGVMQPPAPALPEPRRRNA